MASLSMHCDTFTVTMKMGPDIVDVTEDLRRIVRKADVEDGTLNVTAVGSTGSVTAIEYEPGVIEDLKRAITRLAPPGLEYEHEKAWHDGNGHSHVQAALLGPSMVVPIRRGDLALGPWQQIVLINHDNRPRQRRVEVTVIGAPHSP